jgi:hypothetical protein
MNRITLVVCFLFFYLNSIAQNFEWASAGSNFHTGFNHSCITIDGRLVAGLQYELPSFRNSDDKLILNSGTGKPFEFNYYTNQLLLFCYDSHGDVVWKIEGSEVFGSAILMGISSYPDGNVLVAFRTNYINRQFRRTNLHRDSSYFDNKIRDQDFEKSVFFATIDKSGSVKEITAVEGLPFGDWEGFEVTPDLGLVITLPNNQKMIDSKGSSKTIAFNSTIKLNRKLNLEWHHKVTYSDKSCCSYYSPASAMTVGANGDVFIAGTIRNGYTVDGKKLREVPILGDANKNNPPYESYLGCLSSAGKLKWIKYSGAKSFIYDLSVKNNHLVIGGKIQLAKKMFDVKVDTTEQKKAFIMSLDLNGNIEWLNSFNAEEIKSICQDEQNNIFGVFRSKRGAGMKPLKIGGDTISNSYERIIVGSFDEKGKYRWNKFSNANMSLNTHTKLRSDLCGNLYYTGEMWFSLPVNMSLFDGAITSGRGYGGAPLAARIRTTIPDELIAMNLGISKEFRVKSTKDKLVDGKQFDTRNGVINQRDGIPENSSSAAIDTLRSGRELSCIPMPFPWKIDAFPVPTNGQLTLRISLSYTDPKVKIDLFDSKGAFIRSLMPVQLKDAGEFDLPIDISDLSTGVYVAVLKGSSFGASCRIVVVK